MSLGARLAAASLFWSLAVGLGGAFIYEGFAILTRRDPTISKILAWQMDNNPLLAVPAAFVLGGVCLLLVLHFSGALPWWRP